MQKLETRNGTLLFVEVPERLNDFCVRNQNKTNTQCLSLSSRTNILLTWKKILPKGNWGILGEVTKEGISFDVGDFGFNGELEKASISYTHEDLFRYFMWDNGIEITEGNKFIVLKEKK